jgi:poly(A) polymerase
VIVLVGNRQVEVATFRCDGDYTDGRRPDTVCFADSKTDAMRRDFTINGMFYDPLTNEVIDYVGGAKDIQNKLIRTIGSPEERFAEDYLRMLRAVRFAAELDYRIEKDTLKAIKKYAPNVKNISGERIASELEKIFACERRAEGADMLFNSGIMSVIFPSLKKNQISYGIEVLRQLNPPVPIEKALAAVLIRCCPIEALQLITPLKLSNSRIRTVENILKNRQMLLNPQMELSKLRPLLADERFEMLFDVQRASQIVDQKPLDNLEQIARRAQEFAGLELLPPPLLSGNDIIDLGAKKGPQIGRIIRKLYQYQLDEIIKTKDQAISAVKNWLQSS